MLRFHRGLSMLIVWHCWWPCLGRHCRFKLRRQERTKQAPLESEIASSRSSTPVHSAQSASLVMTSTLDAPTASGPSMYLNGSSYVSIPNASLPVIGSDDFTLDAWVYPTSVTGFHAVMAKWYSAAFGLHLQRQAALVYRGSGYFVETTTPFHQSLDTHRRQLLLRRVGQRLYFRVLHQRRSGWLSTHTGAGGRAARIT